MHTELQDTFDGRECRESLLDAERRNARRGYETETKRWKYLQEYAGKVGEKKGLTVAVMLNRAEDRGPRSTDRGNVKKDAGAWDTISIHKVWRW